MSVILCLHAELTPSDFRNIYVNMTSLQKRCVQRIPENKLRFLEMVYKRKLK